MHTCGRGTCVHVCAHFDHSPPYLLGHGLSLNPAMAKWLDRPVGQLQGYTCMSLFPCAKVRGTLGIQTQVLKLAQEALLHWLRASPTPYE